MVCGDVVHAWWYGWGWVGMSGMPSMWGCGGYGVVWGAMSGMPGFAAAKLPANFGGRGDVPISTGCLESKCNVRRNTR